MKSSNQSQDTGSTRGLPKQSKRPQEQEGPEARARTAEVELADSSRAGGGIAQPAGQVGSSEAARRKQRAKGALRTSYSHCCRIGLRRSPEEQGAGLS